MIIPLSLDYNRACLIQFAHMKRPIYISIFIVLLATIIFPSFVFALDDPGDLFYQHPDPTLGIVPFNYYRIDSNAGTQFYQSIPEARERNNPTEVIDPGSLIYVTYTERIDTDKGTFFSLPNGLFMPGDGSMVSINQPFPGVEIIKDVDSPFGFVFLGLDVYEFPAEVWFNKPVERIEPSIANYPIVPIVETMRIEGVNWHKIGENRWVNGSKVAVVNPKRWAPYGIDTNRWIDVDLAEQSLAVYEDGKMVYATVVATGAEPLYTQPGIFKIYKRLETEQMTGGRGTGEFYYLDNVPWTMYFDKARALHGAYWRAFLGVPQSHGCVNMYPGDAHWVFNWAVEGDYVFVYDTTGLTPTDPALYGDGGA